MYVHECISLFVFVCASCSTLTQNIRERRGEKVAINIPSMLPICAVVVVTYFVRSLIAICAVLMSTVE